MTVIRYSSYVRITKNLIRQNTDSGNEEKTSRRLTPKLRRYLPNVSADHHLLLVITNMFSFVLVNPLAATPFVLPCTGRAVRSRGLQAAGSESRQAQNLPQGKPVIRQCTIPPCQPGLVSNGKSPLGYGSFRRGA